MDEYINIMISCDENLAGKVPVLLQTISENMKDKKIRFFLLHSKLNKSTVEMLKKMCEYFQIIHFYEIVVPDWQVYDELAKRGGGWAGEAYYSICAYKLLPEEVDRVLYVDAGDVMILGNIDEYYFCDFEGKSLITTATAYKIAGDKKVVFEATDLSNEKYLSVILRGIFNSGSYVMNVEKMRNEPYQMEDYLYLSDILSQFTGKEKNIYFGDQGLLAAAFVGDIKFYRYPEMTNIWYMPYNFCLWYFNASSSEPVYKPLVIHFAGTAFKPWEARYASFLQDFQNEDALYDLSELKIGQEKYYNMWYEYALKASETMSYIRTN